MYSMCSIRADSGSTGTQETGWISGSVSRLPDIYFGCRMSKVNRGFSLALIAVQLAQVLWAAGGALASWLDVLTWLMPEGVCFGCAWPMNVQAGVRCFCAGSVAAKRSRYSRGVPTSRY